MVQEWLPMKGTQRIIMAQHNNAKNLKNQKCPCHFPNYIKIIIQGLKLLLSWLVVSASLPIQDFQHCFTLLVRHCPEWSLSVHCINSWGCGLEVSALLRMALGFSKVVSSGSWMEKNTYIYIFSQCTFWIISLLWIRVVCSLPNIHK